MLPKLLKLITHNFSIKLMAILISFGLWAYVASGESKVGDFPGAIPLSTKNTPSGLTAILEEKEVKIRLIAEGATWQKLSPENFTAYVDVIGLGEGIHELPVKVISNLSNAQVVEINPAQVLVRLSPVISKKVPVKIKLEGKPGENLVATVKNIEPSEVEIEGAKTVIDEIDEIEGKIKLKDETEDFNTSVEFSLSSVKITPSSAQIQISIGKGESAKSVGIKAKTNGNPAAGFWISNIKTDPSQITITGSNDILESTHSIETKEINVEGLAENKTFTVELNFPSGISPEKESEDSVKAEIEVSPLNLNKELSVTIIYKNLSDSLKVSSISPSLVKAIVSGSSDKLSALKDGDIKLNINLSGRSSGTHNIDIAKGDFSVPEGISIANFFPSAITIELTTK